MNKQYSDNGSYAGYNKNHKDREENDFYATPSEEVYNILNTINPMLEGSTILEPCCGTGHMMKGIEWYLATKKYKPEKLIGTDLIERELNYFPQFEWDMYFNKDFLNKDYRINDIDFIIMNPPYKDIKEFLKKSVIKTNANVLCLCRLQTIETIKRYEEIFKDNPPSDVFVYVDRIACAKNGDFNKDTSAIQAYCWLYWDRTKSYTDTKLHCIRKYNKIKK